MNRTITITLKSGTDDKILDRLKDVPEKKIEEMVKNIIITQIKQKNLKKQIEDHERITIYSRKYGDGGTLYLPKGEDLDGIQKIIGNDTDSSWIFEDVIGYLCEIGYTATDEIQKDSDSLRALVF